MKRSLAIALVVLATVAAAGTAYAAIPSADGVISACKTKDGAIKLIDTEKGQSCPGSQQLVEWNKAGPAGQDGQDGQDGVSGYETVFEQSATTSSGDKTVWAACPSGKQVLGGGAGVYGVQFAEGQAIVDGVALVQSHPANGTSWAARASEFIPTDDAWYLAVWAICADVS